MKSKSSSRRRPNFQPFEQDNLEPPPMEAIVAVEEEEENEEEEEEALKLEEGFYEIEAIRRRRVSKGEVHYLVKWRGWPESANTWEPIGNLESCYDYIDAFEERLERSSRKRKRKYGGSLSGVGAKSRGGSSSEAASENPNEEEPHFGSRVGGEVGERRNPEDGNEMRVEVTRVNGPSPIVLEGEEEKRDGGRICIQLDGGSREEDCNQPIQGSKKRNSGSMRRFTQNFVQSQENQERTESEDIDSAEDDNDDNGERQKVDNSWDPPYIAKILKPVSFCSSITNNVQKVAITFKALR